MKLFLTIFVLPALIMFLIDYYSFQAIRTVCQGMGDTPRRWIYGLFWGIFVAGVIALLVNYFYNFHLWPKPIRIYLLAAFFVIYISKLLIIPFLLLDDIGRLFRWVKASWAGKPANIIDPEGDKITRSEFLSQAGLIMAAIPAVSLTYGMIFGAYDYKVRKKKMKFANLPAEFDGLKILQISDLHTGTLVSSNPLERAVELINDQNADIVLFTGDLVNDKTDEVYPHMHVLKKIKAKIGVYSSTGNHDYGNYYRQWKNEEEHRQNIANFFKVHEDMGWDLVRNDHRIITRGNSRIAIAGVENWSASSHFPKYGDLDKALSGLEDVPFTILMSHDPTHWEAQILGHPHPIDITFSGHTHGMQFGIDTQVIKWSPVQYIYKQWAGLYKKQDQHLYVNRGLGCLGYPGRAGIRPEITVIELKSA